MSHENQIHYSRNERRNHPTPVFNVDGRIVGHIENGVLFKRALLHHQLKRPPAWAWDVDILEQARAAGCQWTEIECTETDEIFRASLATFDRRGFNFNRGYGEQRALPLAYWQRRKIEETAVEQLGLFGEGQA